MKLSKLDLEIYKLRNKQIELLNDELEILKNITIIHLVNLKLKIIFIIIQL